MRFVKRFPLGLLIAFFFFAAAATFLGAFYHPHIEIPKTFQGQFIDLNGLQLRYLQKGQGPDLLFIHACPGSIEDFEPVMNELSKRYRVTAYDRPGHGFSSGEGNQYTLNYNADVASRLIQKLGLKDVLVIGHSYGAGTALSMAIRNDPNVKGYVLIAAPGYKPVSLDWSAYALGLVPPFGKGFAMFFVPVLGERVIGSNVFRGFAPNRDAVTPQILRTRIQIWKQPKVLVTRSRELLNLEDDLVENSRHYRQIPKKVYIVQGKEDIITKAAWKLHEDIPSSELIVYDGVGHYSQFAKPAEVIGVIARAEKEIDQSQENLKKQYSR